MCIMEKPSNQQSLPSDSVDKEATNKKGLTRMDRRKNSRWDSPRARTPPGDKIADDDGNRDRLIKVGTL